MASIGKIVRRTFLFGAVAVAGVAAFGVWQVRRDAPNPLEPGPDQASLNPFLMIGPEGVTIVTPRAEMGQGAQTTLAALVAEEMDLDWEQVRVMHGPPARAYYNAAALAEGLPNKGYDATALQESLGEMMGSLGKPFEMQITGGSTSMKDGFERMRIAGAAAREALKLAAAERLGVAARDLATGGGQVIAPDGTATPYAELAIAATDHEPRNVILRDRSDWRLLGTALPRWTPWRNRPAPKPIPPISAFRACVMPPSAAHRIADRWPDTRTGPRAAWPGSRRSSISATVSL